jgi:hypothetical protein
MDSRGMVHDEPYRFRIWVKLPDRPSEVEYAITAWSELGPSR